MLSDCPVSYTLTYIIAIYIILFSAKNDDIDVIGGDPGGVMVS